MSEPIFTSVIICSRKRASLLSKHLELFYDLACYPNNTETLIRIDDDDPETEDEYRYGEFFKSHRENVKMYVGPRVGYKYLPVMHKQLYLLSKGDIIVPFGDDYYPILKDWDKMCLKYKDQSVLIGVKLRYMITRKAIEQHKILKNFGWKNPLSDHAIYKFASENNMMVPIPNWFDKAQPRDEVYKEGRQERWKLKDTSILNNLEIREVGL